MKNISSFNKDIYNFNPTVIDNEGRGNVPMDLMSYMLKHYTVFFFGEVNDRSVSALCANILHLSVQDNTREITIYINSHGGSLYDAIAVVDMMRYVSNPISTVVLGKAFSAGALIAAAGTKGRRIAMENSTIMLHQPSSGTQGTATDIQTAAEEIIRMKEMTNQMLTSFSSIEKNWFYKRIERDWFIPAEEALKLGLIDKILYTNDEKNKGYGSSIADFNQNKD